MYGAHYTRMSQLMELTTEGVKYVKRRVMMCVQGRQESFKNNQKEKFSL